MQQNILERHPKAELKVYAVWLEMLASDSREGWDDSLLADRRVEHFWDEKRAVGRALVGPLDYPGPIVWDAYAVYAPDARWGDKPAGAGWTVIGTTDRLERDLRRYLG